VMQGEHILTSRATIPPTVPGGAAAGHALAEQRCGNCASILTGAYCATCGQHAHAGARTLAAVLHDAWHDVTHLDGRLWRTLWLLLVRPGQLTVDYFQERRARYLPPVRLYLVLSLLFFSFSLAPGVPHNMPAISKAAPSTLAQVAKTQQQGGSDSPLSALGKVDIAVHLSCDNIQVGGIAAAERAARDACVRAKQDGGASFLKSLAHNIPKMMFVFLPLLAAVMALLYWRPRRYYVEHLVYLLHNHSALFLSFTLLSLLDLWASIWQRLSVLDVASGIMTLLYAIWYPYRSMRRYYAQGGALTAFKYALLASAYLVCLVFTLVGTAFVTALES